MMTPSFQAASVPKDHLARGGVNAALCIYFGLVCIYLACYVRIITRFFRPRPF